MTIDHAAEMAVLALLMVTFEGGPVLAGYVSLGRLLGLRPSRAPGSTDTPVIHVAGRKRPNESIDPGT